MRKFSIIISLFLVFIFAGRAYSAMPTYSDELPAEYINKYKTEKKVDYKQALPIYNSENALEVKIYTPKKIAIKFTTEKINNQYIARQTPSINDKVDFIVAQDVMKNGKLYIKKGTTATGTVRVAQFGIGVLSSPDELQISLFSTKDVNNKEVELFGTVLNEGKELGLFSSILFQVPSCKASIPKNKIYTVYAKK